MEDRCEIPQAEVFDGFSSEVCCVLLIVAVVPLNICSESHPAYLALLNPDLCPLKLLRARIDSQAKYVHDCSSGSRCLQHVLLSSISENRALLPKQHFHTVGKGFCKPERQHIKVQFPGEMPAVLIELYSRFNTGKSVILTASNQTAKMLV